MTTPAVTVKLIIDTTPDTYIAHISILESTEVRGGEPVLTPELWPFVQSAIEDLLTTLWNGPGGSRPISVMKITKSVSV